MAPLIHLSALWHLVIKINSDSDSTSRSLSLTVLRAALSRSSSEPLLSHFRLCHHGLRSVQGVSARPQTDHAAVTDNSSSKPFQIISKMQVRYSGVLEDLDQESQTLCLSEGEWASGNNGLKHQPSLTPLSSLQPRHRGSSIPSRPSRIQCVAGLGALPVSPWAGIVICFARHVDTAAPTRSNPWPSSRTTSLLDTTTRSLTPSLRPW